MNKRSNDCGKVTCQYLNPEKQKTLITSAFKAFESSKRNKRQMSIYIISVKWWLKWADYVDYKD